MARILFITGVAAIVALLVLVAQQIMQNPIEAKQMELESRLNEAQMLDYEVGEAGELSFSEYTETITQRNDLWQALVELPPPAEEPPDWSEILKGVRFTRQVIGTPPDIRIRAHLSPNDSTGQWVSAGHVVRGARIQEITDSFVLFSITKDGKEYTHRVRR